MMMWGYEKSFEDLLTHEYFLFASKVYARIAKVYFSRILALFKLTSLFTDYLFIQVSYPDQHKRTGKCTVPFERKQV